MNWLEPWWSTQDQPAEFRAVFRQQLELEVGIDHTLFGLPVELIARGAGDDALFQILDGSGRVAQVHLTWSRQQERLPWPISAVYRSLDVWAEDVMRRGHHDGTVV